MQKYEVQAKYTKEAEDGTLKRVKDWFLLTAPMSFTEAEAITYQEVGENIRGAFSIEQIKKVDYEDIFSYDDAELWYKCKLSYSTENADTGKESKISNNYIVEAHTVDEATSRLHESIKGLMVTYEIVSVTKTPIVGLINERVRVLLDEKPAEAEA